MPNPLGSLAHEVQANSAVPHEGNVAERKRGKVVKRNQKQSKQGGETARQLVETIKSGTNRKAEDVLPVNPVLGRLLKAQEELQKAAAEYEAAQKGTALSAEDPIWNLITNKCPRCGHTGPVSKDFGVRKNRGKFKAQAWCRSCRAGKEAHPTRYGLN